MDIKTTEKAKGTRGYLLPINPWLDSPTGKLSLPIATAVIYSFACSTSLRDL
jgi:hypothetical protein